MSSWELRALSSESWDPARHFPLAFLVAGPRGVSSAGKLGQVAETIQAERDEGRAVLSVRPSEVSCRTGAVLPVDGESATLGFRLGMNLRAGDVLVPLRGNGPCVVVTADAKGILFSRAFAAFRPKRAHDEVFIWASLSSTSGILARRSLDRGAIVPRASVRDLEQLELPQLPLLSRQRLESLLPIPAVDTTAAAPLRSHWVNCQLEEDRTWAPGEIFDALDYIDGVRVSELGDLWAGRLVSGGFKEEPWEGSVAAIRPGDVGKLTAPLWWTTAEPRDIAPAGSLLFGSISLRSGVSDGRLAVGREIYVLEPNPSGGMGAEEVSRRLVSYLSSAAGQRRLRSLTTGAGIPRIKKSAFADLRVPSLEKMGDTAPFERGNLAERLEAALWG